MLRKSFRIRDLMASKFRKNRLARSLKSRRPRRQAAAAMESLEARQLLTTLSLSDASVTEGDNLEFVVSLSSAVAHDTVVSYSTAGGSANSSDYTAASGSITISAGDTSGTITVATTDDSTVELDETLSLNVTGVSGTNDVSISDGTGAGTIENDDVMSVTVDDATVLEGGNLEFAVTLSNPVDVDTVLTYSTGDGSATTADSDYTGQAAQTITISAGDTSGTITVATTDDNKVELDETVSISLDGVDAGGREAATAVGGILYQNDFESPNGFVDNTGRDVSLQSVNSLYGQPGFLFQQIFTVETLEINGTAAFGGGYQDPSGTGGNYAIGMLSHVQNDHLSLTFDAGTNAFLNFGIDVSHIDLDGVGGPFGPEPGIAPVFDFRLYDSPSGSFNISSPGTLLDSAQITGTSSARNTFDWTSHVLGLSTARSTDGNVSLVVDLVQGGYAAFDNLVVAASNTQGSLDNGATGTILNDDSATVTVDDASVTEGGSLQFNVSLSNPVDVATVINYSTADGSATTADSDYTGGSGSITIAAGLTSGTITVATTDDNTVELDEVMSLDVVLADSSDRDVTFPQVGANIVFEDTFDSESVGVGYTSLTNWAVTSGNVDVIGDGYHNIYPGNGRYLDMDGYVN